MWGRLITFRDISYLVWPDYSYRWEMLSASKLKMEGKMRKNRDKWIKTSFEKYYLERFPF